MNRGFLCVRIDNVHCGNTAQDTLAQGLDHFAALNQRLHGVALRCAAIADRNDQILCHVNETTRQVTGVCRFQCRISQAFTSAMR